MDLTFLRTIPGTIGGAVRMNAGCYGRYVADVFVSAEAVTREGARVTLTRGRPALRLPPVACPRGDCLISATFAAPSGDPAALAARMEDQLARRDATQPTKDRTAGVDLPQPGGPQLDRRGGGKP